MKNEPIRIQKYLANQGVCSRRAAEDLIRDGRVSVNNTKATLGDRCIPGVDTIRVNGKTVGNEAQEMVYMIYHKPVEMQTTMKFFPDKKTLANVNFGDVRVFPVGRLDKNSRGLLLMTNDGDLAHKLMHPRYHHPKTYIVRTERKATKAEMQLFKTGVEIEGKRTAPALISPVGKGEYQVTLFEGRKRQIRLMFKALNNEVKDLLRTHIGTIELGELPAGQFRNLTPKEIKELKKIVAER